MNTQSTARTRLGVVAVGACTLIAALPLVSAAPAQAAHSGKVEFYSPFIDLDAAGDGPAASYDTVISGRDDGTDQTVHLLVDAPGDTTSVTFSYAQALLPGLYTTIGTDSAPPWSFDWDVSPFGSGAQLILRAEATTPTGTTVDREGVTVLTSESTVSVTQPDLPTSASTPQSIGRFNGTVIARGTVGPNYAGDVTVQDITGPSAPSPGPRPPTATPTSVTVTPKADDTWAALVPTNTDPTRGAVYINAATAGPDPTDETDFGTVYEQNVQPPVVTPSPINDSTQGSGPTTITATVNDQQGKPVGGVLVELDLNRDGDAGDAGETSAMSNTEGQVSFEVPLASTTEDTTRQISIIANQDSTPGFNSVNGDQRTTVTQNTAVPVVTSAVIIAADATPQTVDPGSNDNPAPSFPRGATAFNVAEEDPSIRVEVLDQNGTLVPDSLSPIVTYTIGFDPDENGGPAQANTTTTGTVQAVNGIAAIPVSGAEGSHVVSAYINRDSDLALTPADLAATDVTYTFDQATLRFDGDSSTDEAGTSITRTLTYALDGGAPLVGRLVEVDLTPGAAADMGGAFLSPTQPSGLRRSTTNAVLGTDATGKALVNVVDPSFDTDAGTAGVQLANENATLTAAAQTSPGGLPQDVAPAATTTARFIVGASPAEVRLTSVVDRVGSATPGRPVEITLNVDNTDDGTDPDTGVDLAGVAVSLSVDKGYLTSRKVNATESDDSVFNGTNGLTFAVPATAPTGPSPVGAYRRDANGKQLRTDADGNIRFSVAIDRDADFDADGIAVVTVTATAGGVTREIPVTFFTDETGTVTTPATPGGVAYTLDGSEPLNGKADMPLLILSPAGPVPAAISSANDGQAYYVAGFDQFGNPVKVDYTLTPSARTTILSPMTSLAGEFADPANADFTVTSSLPDQLATGPEQTETVNLVATHTFATTLYGDSDGGTAGFQATEPYVVDVGTQDRTGTLDLFFYTPIVDQYQFGYAATPSGVVALNAPVNAQAGVADQRSTPVPGVDVQFIRSGPGAITGGTTSVTNESGLAGFTFTSALAGQAVVTAIVSVNNNELSRGVLNVEFGDPVPAPVISGAAKRFYDFGQNLTIAGTATPGANVEVWFDRRGPEGPRRVRILNGTTERAAGSNAFSYTVRPGDDYRIYVVVDGKQSNTIIAFALPTIDAKPGQAQAGDVIVQPAVNNRLTASGRAPAGAPFVFYYRIQGQAQFRLQVLTTGSNGVWTRPLALPEGKPVVYYVQRGGDTPRSAVYQVR